jgi:hypothetical protein
MATGGVETVAPEDSVEGVVVVLVLVGIINVTGGIIGGGVGDDVVVA